MGCPNSTNTVGKNRNEQESGTRRNPLAAPTGGEAPQDGATPVHFSDSESRNSNSTFGDSRPTQLTIVPAENEEDLESLTSSDDEDEGETTHPPGADGPEDQVSPRAGQEDEWRLPTVRGDDDDLIDYTPTIRALGRQPKLVFASKPPGQEGEDGAEGVEIVPRPLPLDKDAIYTTMGVDTNKAVVHYGVKVPENGGRISASSLDSGSGGKVPNADDTDIFSVGRDKWEEIQKRSEAKRKKMQEELSLIRTGSSTPPPWRTPSPNTPILPTPKRVKAAKLPYQEPYLRYVDVTVLSSSSITSAGKRIKVLELSQDEKELAWCTCEDKDLHLTHLQSQRSIGTFKGHTDRILGASIALVGASYYVATASVDRLCVVWDRNKGRIVDSKMMLAHVSSVVSVNFSPCYKYLVTGCQDKKARIYFVRTGDAVVLYGNHRDVVFYCGFSPDSALVASCSFDLTVQLWSAKNGRERYIFRGHTKIPMVASFTPDGRKLISNDDKEIRVWDISGNRGCLRVFPVAVCIPSPGPAPSAPPEGAPKPKPKSYGWTFSRTAPGKHLGNTHIVVGCTNGCVYIFQIDPVKPAPVTVTGGGGGSDGGGTRSSSSIITPGEPTKQPSPSEKGFLVTKSTDDTWYSEGTATEGAADAADGQKQAAEITIIADRSYEAWSFQCRGAVYALTCGPNSTIACGDLTGNVYLIKVVSG